MSKQRHTFPMLFSRLPSVLLTMITVPLTALAQSDATVRLEVGDFRNNIGTLNCRLFARESDFPDGEGVLTVRVPITGRKAVCAFPNIEAGTYAVAVVHDENNNGRVDKNFLGIPTEGYGASNNRTYALSSPKWEESKLVLKPSETLILQVNLRY
ncbi:MAG: DUF2141 domain-containing protein [Burkholderiales bacterium]|jgi:uncharacterized protein (DUF2141 family)|nr:DUF2141 domain-containing protein [Burkholderiales bacterium]MCA3162612.1 DUF2141 domain-containing protein [Burkholderiales bacterium]MCA3162853.1 DUF2141 domain-containing protein [Burkholderiales bacterium]MCA3166618.1 DUF2141 domain-containing protein [Burkholderiales bacterium]MCA3170680.1 DUF2141 domain-containing protein [Burkholderiales bacterium]